ncbi:unnamed protein product [Blepharisma stoltei]|uniref:Kynurenine formamidase n=1 Tax=Blepharisma stoltei TaxID=1481888 RepID=A0AAU9II82_9CILI|nr:unnamed protein product [Blepharisma stoltei]
MSELFNSLLSNTSIIDCTHTINENTVIWPGDPTFSRRSFNDQEYSIETYQFIGGSATHIDAPKHFLPNGRTISDLQPNELISEGVLIDVASKCEKNNDYELSIEDINLWESRNGRIPCRSIVCMRTGWGAKFNKPDEYKNHNPEEEHPHYSGGVMHFPGFSREAAEFLCRERNINAIGIDTLSLDPGKSVDFEVHYTIFRNNKYQIENMKLENLPDKGFVMIALPYPVENAPEFLARVIALVKNE